MSTGFINRIGTQLKTMWHAAPLATGLLALCLSAAVFFGARTVAETLYWNDPAHRNQPIAGWMTPRYVAHSWNIPRPEMIAILQSVAPEFNAGDRPGSMKDIAAQHAMPLKQFIAQIEAEISTYRANQTAPETRK
ncbi:hypothetical protein [Aliiroseovarius crassostreae]|uniref:hypothetical protein n=1 Tax=Aliiroseovarius crassostreae TaxID=154981 RepID=UPI003C7D73AC